MRALLHAILALAAPAALAWPACDQAGITPPVAIVREAPSYPPAVREIGIEGSVEVALTVLRDGHVGWVRVLRADPPGYFEQAALAGVRAWRFEPARQDGGPGPDNVGRLALFHRRHGGHPAPPGRRDGTRAIIEANDPATLRPPPFR